MALRALGFEPSATEIKRLLQKVADLSKDGDHEDRANEDGSTSIDYQSFEEIMTIKMSERDAEAELRKAFE